MILLGDVFKVIWRQLWIVVLVMVLLAGTALAVSLTQTPEYEASAKILIGQEQGVTESAQDVAGLQQLTMTMAQAVKTDPIAEAVIQRLGLEVTPEDFLEDNLSVDQIATTQFIEVGYKDTDPERAQLVANTVGEVFSEQIPSTNFITATLWEQARLPRDPVSPNFLLNISLALVLGAVLGVGLAFLLESRSDSRRSPPQEAEQTSGVPTDGAVPRFEGAGRQTFGRRWRINQSSSYPTDPDESSRPAAGVTRRRVPPESPPSRGNGSI